DESWVEVMQEELLQFQLQPVWILVDLPFGKKAIGTKWVFRNKKYERSIIVKNKVRLVAQGHRQEEGIDYDEDHPKGQILGDPTLAVQIRGKIQKASSAQQALVSYIYRQNRTNHKDHQNSLFACFLSQEEPKTISQALKDESWVEATRGIAPVQVTAGLVTCGFSFWKEGNWH
ncbi:putative ribonuclease H-like domain-containing protein, partial [Tanacetum coccineum]